MRLDELKEAAYHGIDTAGVEQLLHAVAKVMPFVGYESSGAERLKDELNKAFEDVTGMRWYEWQEKQNGDV